MCIRDRYQNPSEGVQCVSGTKVTITLSKGAAPAPTEQVAVPNVVTLTLEQAQGVLESAGLACKFAGEEEGMVVEQSLSLIHIFCTRTSARSAGARRSLAWAISRSKSSTETGLRTYPSAWILNASTA